MVKLHHEDDAFFSSDGDINKDNYGRLYELMIMMSLFFFWLWC